MFSSRKLAAASSLRSHAMKASMHAARSKPMLCSRSMAAASSSVTAISAGTNPQGRLSSVPDRHCPEWLRVRQSHVPQGSRALPPDRARGRMLLTQRPEHTVRVKQTELDAFAVANQHLEWFIHSGSGFRRSRVPGFESTHVRRPRRPGLCARQVTCSECCKDARAPPLSSIYVSSPSDLQIAALQADSGLISGSNSWNSTVNAVRNARAPPPSPPRSMCSPSDLHDFASCVWITSLMPQLVLTCKRHEYNSFTKTHVHRPRRQAPCPRRGRRAPPWPPGPAPRPPAR